MVKRIVFFLFCISIGITNALSKNSNPFLLELNLKTLQKNKADIEKGDISKKKALEGFLKTVEKIVENGKLYSVTHKKQVPPSGDKHDYMSMGPYWWPDPTKPNGLPYIRKDGQVNPEYHDITDTEELDDMAADVEFLGLAYFYTKNEKYAGLAAKILKTWFLETDTKMNPNLNFGQSIPGLNTGRGTGIIESRGLVRALDGVLLIQSSKSWSNLDHQNLTKWFSDYLGWLTESKYGIEESNAKNNHGTHYDAQTIAFALFVGNHDLARQQLEKTKKRIESQIEPDGSQPHELARTASWSYTNMNLNGFFNIAQLAENVDVNLWKFQTPNGKSIKTALDWFLPFVRKERNWEYQQIKKFDNSLIIRNLKIAALKYQNTEYDALAKSFDPKVYQADYINLVF
jgi:hypothetical protein